MTRISPAWADPAASSPRALSGRDLPHSVADVLLKSDRPGALYTIRVVILLALITLAVHGLALFDGKVLDDFWHQKGLREHGWSFSELLHTLIIAPGDFLHTWWQTKPVVWHYFRPFFIVCMKLVFNELGHGDPKALHAFSLILHFASALMVSRLCWLLTRDRAWSFIGGAIFIIYPHSTITVSWPSSQNVVLQTTLLLAAMLCYIRAFHLIPHSAWSSPAAAGIPHWENPQSARHGEAIGRSRAIRNPQSPSRLYLAAAILFWLLALFTRENAVLIPIILAAIDLSFGGREHFWARRRLYAALFAIAAAFMAWRYWLHIPPLPDVYCRRPDGDWPEYLPWLAAKFLHYICAAVWVAPMTLGPTGRYNPWTEVPGDCVLMLAIVVILAVIYWRAARLTRGWWIWPLWIVLSIVPVTAVVATPHSGYMCGVGFAIAVALAPVAARRQASRHLARIATATSLVLVLGCAFMTPVNRLQWAATYSGERYLPSWVMVSPPPRDTRDVFFFNMPFVNIYSKPNLVDRLGPWFEDVNVHVLTYAPDPMKMDRPSVLDQRDDHTFTLSVEGQPYFSRLLGRFLLEGFRRKGRFTTGDRVSTEHFDVTILDADAEGVWKLQFTFRRPLADPHYCFYFTSPECGAARIRFTKGIKPVHALAAPLRDEIQLDTAIAELNTGRVSAAAPLFATAIAAQPPWAGRAAGGLLPVVRHMGAALGAPVQSLLALPDLTPTDWERVRAWWDATVDQRRFDEIWAHRHDFDDLIYLRYEIDFDRHIAGVLLRSDLYLSGPPYPGPRNGPLSGQ